MLFDSNENIIISDFDYLHAENCQLFNDTFCCPRCYEIAEGDDVNLQKKAKRCKCKPLFEDGITKITKENYEPSYKKVINNLGKISRALQELDFAVTDVKVLKDRNRSMYIYAENNNPLGYIVISPYRDTYLATDFMVVEYKQRQGIGYKIFEYMLKDLSTSPDRLVYDSPSYPSSEFLFKYYGMEKAFILI